MRIKVGVLPAILLILITSSQPGEGKTSTTVHLALSLSQLGSSVVVVDADMRKPRVHCALGIEAAPGLAEVLQRAYSAFAQNRP